MVLPHYVLGSQSKCAMIRTGCPASLCSCFEIEPGIVCAFQSWRVFICPLSRRVFCNCFSVLPRHISVTQSCRASFMQHHFVQALFQIHSPVSFFLLFHIHAAFFLVHIILFVCLYLLIPFLWIASYMFLDLWISIVICVTLYMIISSMCFERSHQPIRG